MNNLKLLNALNTSHKLSPKMFLGSNLLFAPLLEIGPMCREMACDNPLIRFSPPRALVSGMGDDDFYYNLPETQSMDDVLSLQVCTCPGFTAFKGKAADPSFWSSLLDVNGYLNCSVYEVARLADANEQQISVFIENLKNHVEPAGLFAASLEESLLIQLRQSGYERSVAWRMMTEGIDYLISGNIDKWAKASGICEKDIENALALLKKLDPSPGRNFIKTTYILPEVEYIAKNGKITTRLILENIPCVENLFCEFDMPPEALLKENWLKREWSKAKGILKRLGMRYRTVLRCALYIAETQSDKICAPEHPPKPLTYTDAGRAIHLHASTLFRCVKNTACLINGHCYPMSMFFSRPASANKALSVEEVRSAIVSLRNEGMSNREIGERLGLPERTVSYHRSQAKTKRK